MAYLHKLVCMLNSKETGLYGIVNLDKFFLTDLSPDENLVS